MSKQYRVMVVEDEEIERNALTMMLRYNCEHVRDILAVENGVYALDAVRTFGPDIVLMDINLPGINGLETIRQIQKLDNHIRFVLISAHSQFSYAQEAIRLGVYDFLVKPISVDEICRVMNEMVGQDEGFRTRLEREKLQQEKMDAIRPILESDCVFSIASMRSNTPIATIFDFMQIRVNSGYVFLIQGRDQSYSILNIVKNQMCGIGITCIGEIINDLCVFVALSEKPMVRSRVVDTMRYICQALHSRNISCSIGVGSTAVCADDLRKSYEQGIAAVRRAVRNGEEIIFFDEIQPNAESGSKDVNFPAQRICELIRGGDCEAVQEALHRFFAALQLSDTVENKAIEQVYWLYVIVYSRFPEYSDENPPMSANQMLAYRDIQALRDVLTATFLDMANQISGRINSAQSNKTVNAALQIIGQRYMDNLTLDDVAEELNFSVFYLSKLFKKQTGVTFTEYLTKYRIEKAKAFLESGTMSVKEIAFATGYNSQGYFSKIFRKYTGVSPSEYTGKA